MSLDQPTTASLYEILARLGLNGPPLTMDKLAEVIEASAPAPGLLTYSRAEAIGRELHDHFEKMAGSAPLDREDMAWGDIVQFVIRKAREGQDGR